MKMTSCWETVKDIVNEIIGGAETDAVFSALLYRIGLEFFYIHEKSQITYEDMLNIVMIKYATILENLSQAINSNKDVDTYRKQYFHVKIIFATMFLPRFFIGLKTTCGLVLM